MPAAVGASPASTSPTWRLIRASIEHWGAKCVVCGFDFERVYGSLGEGYIHVHHLIPIAAIGEEYDVDAIEDLRPVCANCHAMIHFGGATRPVEEIRALVQGLQRRGDG